MNWWRAMALFGFALPAAADSYVTGGSIVCYSELAFYQFYVSVIDDDLRSSEHLIEEGECGVMKHSFPVSILETGEVGEVKIRIYVDGGAFEGWTIPTSIVSDKE